MENKIRIAMNHIEQLRAKYAVLAIVCIFGTFLIITMFFVIKFAWPKIVEWWQSEDLHALAHFADAFAAVGTFLVVFLGLGFAVLEVRDVAKARRLDVMREIYKAYRAPEMGDAVHAVWNSPPEVFRQGSKKDAQRRIVSDFWTWVGWMYEEGLTDVHVIHKRFQDGINIWEKLEPLEFSIRMRIEERDHPELSLAEKQKKANDFVNDSPPAKLYGAWKKRYGFTRKPGTHTGSSSKCGVLSTLLIGCTIGYVLGYFHCHGTKEVSEPEQQN
jgi:hypothetical protein